MEEAIRTFDTQNRLFYTIIYSIKGLSRTKKV